MRVRVLLGSVVALLVAAVVWQPAAGAAPTGGYIVVLKGSVGSAAAVAAEQARTRGLVVGHVYSHALKGYSAVMSAADAQALRADPRVASVSQDRLVHVDAQVLPTGIDRVDGELSSTVSGNGAGSVNVDVAVIDTGIDTTHPDLDVAGGVNCSTGRSFNDGNGHGSHVAGIIAAKDNDIGVVGVAPGARLWAVRVLNPAGSGSFASVICGVDWVTAHSDVIEVANMSLGGAGTEPAGSGCATGDPLHDAICNSVAAGVTYTVAAGNSADDAANHVPAAYDEVITVSALADFDGEPGGLAAPTCRADQDDTLADFSNFGADVDLIAPGVCILSTYRKGGYATLSGTSMASPHAGGAAALYKASHPAASPAAVKRALQQAGNLGWNNVDDPDGVKEVLVNVDAF
ncbi:MAG TPA: S8 family serine peptidase [Actinomycetes bacterium]|jgi:subtilisin family serine protease|nr:S8 family serine peptidase [Actinomycetes bacterium]